MERKTKKIVLFSFLITGVLIILLLITNLNLNQIKIPFLKSRAFANELTIKIKLQGEYDKIVNPYLKTKVVFYTVYGKVREYSDLKLVKSQANIFSLQIDLADLPLNQLYALFIKPDKYLGRLFCQVNSYVPNCNNPGIALQAGQNLIDFTQFYFFSGDIAPQDGKVTAEDISKILRDIGKITADYLETDINSDLMVKIVDYSLALYSLSKNYVDDVIPFPNSLVSTIFPSSLTPTSLPTPTSQPSLEPTKTPTPSKKPKKTPTPTKKPTKTPTPKPITSPSASPTSSPTSPIPTGAVNCFAMDNGLPNSTMHYPNGSTTLPSTTKEICAFNSEQYYSLPYRNPNCTATQAGIDRAYERMKSYYPSYWQQTRLKDDWQTVQLYSKKYNFNPLFVIALWIEESAAWGARGSQQLGCLYRLNKDDTFTFLGPNSTICEQMECLFGRRSVVPENYALWACQYQHGSSKWSDNHCLKRVSFTKGIEYWYNYIGENLPTNCQIQYYSPADSRCGQ